MLIRRKPILLQRLTTPALAQNWFRSQPVTGRPCLVPIGWYVLPMWGRRQRKIIDDTKRGEPPQRLTEALRKARVDQADRSGTVVDLQDAELARLELLNEALDPLFEEIPATIDLFDRGTSRGATPRLWIDAVTHVDMGRDKRIYRFLQDTRYGRKVLAENVHIVEIVDAVTKYVAQRMVERERALADGSFPVVRNARRELRRQRRRARWRSLPAFLLGICLGFAALIAAALLFGPKG